MAPPSRSMPDAPILCPVIYARIYSIRCYGNPKLNTVLVFENDCEVHRRAPQVERLFDPFLRGHEHLGSVVILPRGHNREALSDFFIGSVLQLWSSTQLIHASVSESHVPRCQWTVAISPPQVTPSRLGLCRTLSREQTGKERDRTDQQRKPYRRKREPEPPGSPTTAPPQDLSSSDHFTGA